MISILGVGGRVVPFVGMSNSQPPSEFNRYTKGESPCWRRTQLITDGVVIFTGREKSISMCHLNPVSIDQCLAGYGVTQSVRVMTRSRKRCGAEFSLLADSSGAGSTPAIVAILKRPSEK